MAKLIAAQKAEIISNRWPWSPVRYNVWALIDQQGFRGSFEQLYYTTQAKKPRLAKVLIELFDAGMIGYLPAGTPAQIVEGSASDALLIEGTCVDVTEVH